ncbi:MAG: hypothetical protein AB1634_02945 [Thermodesulfobacteriota bacterium]
MNVAALADRRQNPRYAVEYAEFLVSGRFVEVVDMSLQGLAILDRDAGFWPLVQTGRGSLYGDDRLYLEGIPFRTANEVVLPDVAGARVPGLRRLGIQFGSLTPAQQERLDFFIWVHSTKSA